MKEFSYEEIEAATGGFALDRLVGKGSHGCVYKGILQSGKQVAVKKSLDWLQSYDSKLDLEIDVLASVHAPQLVNLLGVCRSPATGHRLLVMEFMPNGSLHDMLHSSSSSAPPPSWLRRVAIALQIAQAVLSLHKAEPCVIHRDIKSENILFDRRWNARLADFSLAVRNNTSRPDERAMPAGTLGYLDPSYTDPMKLSPKNDVFSFGVLLLELLSARRVMDVDRHPASIVEWAVPLLRARRAAEVCDSTIQESPANVKATTHRVLNIAVRCVSSKEDRRPLMAEVVGELRELMAEHQAHGCLFPLRRWMKRKVKASKIVCRDHFLDFDDADEDDGHVN